MIKKKTYFVVIAVITIILSGCAAKSGDELVLQGIKQYENEDYIGAIESYSEALEAGLEIYDEAYVQSCLGNCYDTLGLYDKALEAHTVALELDGEQAKYWVNIGVTYRKMSEYDLAADAYIKAIELDPEYAEAYSSLAVIHYVNSQYTEAIECYETAIELSPSLASAYGGCALAYAMIDDFENADIYLENAKALGYANYEIVSKRIDELR